MITIEQLLSPKRTLANQEDDSKKRVLHHISEIISQDISELDCQQLFEDFIARERIGSTGIGHGVALPHVKSERIEKPLAALIHLHHSIDFLSSDNLPVDLVFALVVPNEFTDEHVKILSLIATKFHDINYRENLRNANDSTKIYNLAIKE